MTDQKKPRFCLYKIYSENCLLYVGSTKQPIKDTLHEHFFKEHKRKPIYVECVERIEYAFLPTEADLLVAEAFYLNKLKPALNQAGIARDTLNIDLPDIKFSIYECEELPKWKEQIRRAQAEDIERKCMRFQLEKERSEKLQEIFSLTGLTDDEKQTIYDEWLRNFYEPVRNGLL